VFLFPSWEKASKADEGSAVCPNAHGHGAVVHPDPNLDDLKVEMR
jgi:hypothetical protein